MRSPSRGMHDRKTEIKIGHPRMHKRSCIFLPLSYASRLESSLPCRRAKLHEALEKQKPKSRPILRTSLWLHQTQKTDRPVLFEGTLLWEKNADTLPAPALGFDSAWPRLASGSGPKNANSVGCSYRRTSRSWGAALGRFDLLPARVAFVFFGGRGKTGLPSWGAS